MGSTTGLINGLNTNYRIIGDGPPILMLHGARLGYSLEAWDDVSIWLGEHGFRAISIDQPGYGMTDNPTDYSRRFLLDFLREFVRNVCEEPVHLIGHSQSGGTAVQLALDSPDVVRTVVIAGTGSLMPVTLALASAMGREVRRDDGDRELNRPPNLEETRLDFLGDVYDPTVLTPERIELLNSKSQGKNFDAAMERRRLAADRHRERNGSPLWQRLQELAMPVLAIYGEQDKNHAAERMSSFNERNPKVESHLIGNCKHIIHWDAPEEFVQIVSRFVAAHG